MNPAAAAYWQKYLASLTEKPVNPVVSASYAGTRETANELLKLYLEGKKHAGSSLVADYVSCNEPLPKIGNYWIVLDGNDVPRAICKTIRVQIAKFKDVGEDVARAEGEGDLSLEYWRKTHVEFWSPFLVKWGVSDLCDAEVVTELFEVIGDL